MRDKTHQEQIERWGYFCRDNPNKSKKQLKLFLDAQIIMARRFYKNLSQTEEGKKILKRLKQEKLRK